MASLYPNTTTDGYEHFMNYSMNPKVTMSFSMWDWDMFHFILYTIVGGAICIVGFIANIICYVVLKADSGKKHRIATFLLQALAVADNLYLTFSFYNLSIIIGLLPMLGEREKTMSKLLDIYNVVYISPFVSMASIAMVWITVLIAVNRYIAVCKPFDAHRLASLKRTKIQVAVVFTFAIIVSLPSFFQYTIVYPEDYDSITVPSRTETNIGPSTLFGQMYSIGIYVISLLIVPLILLITFNTKIIWELRKADKRKDAIRWNGSRSENNITVVMVVIVIVFIVCNISYPIYVVAWYTSHYSYSLYIVYCVSQSLFMINSSTNFVVYYVLQKSFRKAFLKALSCCQPQALVV